MYQALVAQLMNVRKHPNADRLLLAGVDNGAGQEIATVVVSLDQKNGDIGIFFEPDLQLSEIYALANDLVARFDPETGKKVGGGFFDATRRVRAQSFRGVKSYGFWMPIESLSFVNLSLESYSPGTMFNNLTDLDGTEWEICRRYYTDAQLTQRADNVRAQRLAEQQRYFPKHGDTENLRLHLREIPKGARIIISSKLHGTSARVGNTRMEVPTPAWKQNVFRTLSWLARREIKPRVKWDYTIVHGTRNIVVTPEKEGFHGKEQFRFDAVGEPQLERDLTIYGEIVGFANGKPIMPDHTVEDKELIKQFGPEMRYSYGCADGEARFVLYHARRVVGDQIRHVLFDELQAMAEYFGYPMPHLYADFIYEGDEKWLWLMALQAAGDPWRFDPTDPTHIQEGVVLRVEFEGDVKFYKFKSQAFCELEGIRVYETPEDLA